MHTHRKRKPAYQKIYESLLLWIDSGDIDPGDQLPTEAKLSQSFRVSRITARRAVQELERRGIVTRIAGRGTFLRDRSEWVQATEKRSSEKGKIAVVLPFGLDEADLFSRILHSVEVESRVAGYSAAYLNSRYELHHETEILDMIKTEGYAGAIIYPQSSFGNIEAFQRLKVNGFPFVLIDRDIEPTESCFIGIESASSFATVIAHLSEHGHERIAFVGSAGAESRQLDLRLSSFVKAMTKAGKLIPTGFILSAFPSNREIAVQDRIIERGTVRMDYVRSVLRQLFASERPPTAIAAASDLIASYLLRAAVYSGLRIPEDLSITGFDNNVALSEHIHVPLTTVGYRSEDLGSSAVSLLCEQIGGGGSSAPSARKRYIPTRLIIRKSTGAARISKPMMST